jgi:SAM-dependent methyltransferase
MGQTHAGPDRRYTLDVDFPSGFNFASTPAYLHACAGLAGFEAVDPRGAFTLLDIGCGEGVNLALAAAIHPEARFIGVELNPAHAEAARRTAQELQLANLDIIEGDFAKLPPDQTPRADYVTCTGLFSWLPDRAQRRLTLLARRAAGNHGLICVDYAAQPGSAGTDALYAAMRALAPVDGASPDRLSTALDEMKALRGSGARFFEAYGGAAGRLADMSANDLAGEAHEVFNLERGLWSSQVAALFGEAGADFLSHLSLRLASDVLSLPAGGGAACGPASSHRGQILRDLMRNTAHRADVFKTGSLAGRIPMSLLDRPCYAGPGIAGAQARLAAAHPDGGGRLAGVRSALARPGIRVGDLLDILEQDGGMLRDLAGADLVRIGLRPPPAEPSPGPKAFQPAFPAIGALLRADLVSNRPRPLPSPVTGEGVDPPPGDRLALLTLFGDDPKALRARLRSAGGRGPWPELDDAAFADRLASQARRIEGVARALTRLGLVVAAPHRVDLA